MTKAVYCRDVGFDCDGAIRAGTEEEALAQRQQPTPEKPMGLGRSSTKS